MNFNKMRRAGASILSTKKQEVTPHHKKSEQKPWMVVDSRPLQKNSSWMPLMPRAENSGDLLDPVLKYGNFLGTYTLEGLPLITRKNFV